MNQSKEVQGTQSIVRQSNDEQTNLQDQKNSRTEKRPEKNQNSNYNKPCWYFVNYGYCRYGSNCRYIHPKYNYYYKYSRKPNKQNLSHSNKAPLEEVGEASGSHENRTLSSKHQGSNANSGAKRVFSKCRVFTNSNRHHQQPKIPESGLTEKNEATEVAPTQKPILNTRMPLDLNHLTEEDVKNLCQTETTLLKKRYSKLNETQEEDKNRFSFTFSPSDPDWMFDIKQLYLEIEIPVEYPSKICDIHIRDEEQHLPPMFLKFLNQQVKSWLQERFNTNFSTGKIELVLRPFFRWFDRSLEELFVTGLRKVKLDVEAKNAGIDFVPYEELPGASNTNSSDSQDTNNLKKTDDDEVSDSEDKSESSQSISSDNKESNSSKDNKEQISTETVLKSLASVNSSRKKGTEIKLLNLDLTDSVASLQCQKLSIVIRCMRCNTYSDVETLSKQKRYVGPCSKCHQELTVDFEPILIHAFSSVMGYLNMTGCQAVDLPIVQCQFVITCFNCNKQNCIDGVHYGQAFSTWCLFCNKKLCFSVHSAKFVLLQPIEMSKTNRVLDGTKKKVREQVIEEGKPLPMQGTCKHYKKSHRWLRFPCCGKAYPCDACHDEQETDHEMKFAVRMICGYCCKEQPFSKDRPCISCSSTMAKKSGSYWEGGKGCRSKVKMNREDQHKYSGTNKTISRKAASLQGKKKQ